MKIATTIVASRAGLSLGKPIVFWSPAIALGLALVATAYFTLPPLLLSSSSSVLVTGLNIFYPVTGFVLLIPCAVLVRIGFKFRGGRLLLVWLPIALGVTAGLAADILFTYLTSFGLVWTERVVDFLYPCAYWVVACGILFQWAILSSENYAEQPAG